MWTLCTCLFYFHINESLFAFLKCLSVFHNWQQLSGDSLIFSALCHLCFNWSLKFILIIAFISVTYNIFVSYLVFPTENLSLDLKKVQ